MASRLSSVCILLTIILLGCNPTKPPVLRTINFAADSFDPVHEVDFYSIYAFRVSDFVIVTKPQLGVTIPDTLEVSWNQPKRRTAKQPMPVFYQHVDTAFVAIDNNPSLYKWLASGNDSSVWIDAKLEGLYEGSWELSVRTFAIDGSVSQYSDPFEFKITFVKVPAAAIDVRLWIK